MREEATSVIEDLMGLYLKYGEADYIGEPVSQIEHMSQAAQLAMKEGYDDEVVLAAFLHDIGHICQMHDQNRSMGGYGLMSHEKIGANFLRSKGFSERIAKLVENHVQAKRYLTFKYPEYYQALSEASRQTLKYQGGIMTAHEASLFEQDPLFETSIRMRTWDEMAKETDVPVLDLGLIKSRMLKVLTKTW